MRKTSWIIILFVLLAALFAVLPPASAGSHVSPLLQSDVLCGNGGADENYGFTYDLAQYHWTVGWESYVDEDIVDQVDKIFDGLDADNIAQPMILFKPENQVGNRVNCAVHFLRYMQLGQPSGLRKDNGFVLLIVIEDGEIDVHYGVGLGLPALTAHGLTDLNRLAEDTYESTGSMNAMLLELANGFDQYARSKYEPYIYPTPTPAPPSQASKAANIFLVCTACTIILVFAIILVMIARAQKRKQRSSPFTSGYSPRRPRTTRPSSRPSGPVRPIRPRPTYTPRYRPRPSSTRSAPRPAPRRPTRRGGGSGRSGRGN